MLFLDLRFSHDLQLHQCNGCPKIETTKAGFNKPQRSNDVCCCNSSRFTLGWVRLGWVQLSVACVASVQNAGQREHEGRRGGWGGGGVGVCFLKYTTSSKLPLDPRWKQNSFRHPVLSLLAIAFPSVHCPHFHYSDTDVAYKVT